MPKIKKNDGGHKAFGIDIDPNKNLVHNTQKDGSCNAYYKGSKMKYDDYLTELETRYDKNSKGKDFTSNSIGLFKGVSFDKDGNIIYN